MAANSGLRFGKEVIDRMPMPVALSLQQLGVAVKERNKSNFGSLNVLWSACDAVELILRLLVSIAIAELHQRNRLNAVASQLATAIDTPTLGQWRWLLVILVPQLDSDTVLLELKKNMTKGGPIDRFFSGASPAEKDDPSKAFLALRNRLAHGAGLTEIAAANLLKEWEKPIRGFLDEILLWMGELVIDTRGADGRSCRLIGLEPQAYDSEDPVLEPAGAVIRVKRAGHRLQLWPLICYGPPLLIDKSGLHPAVQLYARRSAIDTLQYTPLGTEEAYWSFSDGHATKVLDAMLLREEFEKKVLDAVGAVASFTDELQKESKQMVGREGELRYVRDALKHHRGRLLWIYGEPGSGKSTLLAKLSVQLRQAEFDAAAAGKPARLVLPYRFKVGDGRCAAPEFFKLIEQAIDPSLALSPQRDYNATTTAKALQGVTTKGIDCVLVLDGLDEIDSIDRSFVTDVCITLAKKLRPDHPDADGGRVTWICAGREHLTESMKQGDAVILFEDGLPGMTSQDIRSMLLDRIGQARGGLLKKDKITNHKVIPIPYSPDLADQLDTGRVPQEIFTKCKGQSADDRTAGPATRELRALAIVKGEKWLIDDNDCREMYFVDIDKQKARLRIHIDRVESPFITETANRSAGLPIYVRCVVYDILGKGDTSSFDAYQLPESLEAFYHHLIDSSGLGDVTTLLTPLICLIAVARDSISAEQLVSRAREHMNFLTPEDASSVVMTALRRVSPMLRKSQDRRKQMGFTIYHKSFRDYLDPPAAQGAGTASRPARNNLVKNSIFDAKLWLCNKSREAAERGLAHVEPFADYVAHYGIDHLLEIHKLAPDKHTLATALRLYATLAQRTDLDAHDLRSVTLTVMAKRIADAVNKLVKVMRSDDDPAERRRARQIGSALPENALLVLIHAIYETTTRKGAIRVLAELSDDWDVQRRKLHSPYDMVLRVDTGEVLAELWEDAHEDEKPRHLHRLVAMTTDPDLEEREIAWYALVQIFLNEPKQIELYPDVLKRWAQSEINVERMILCELLLGLAGVDAKAAEALERALPPSDYPAFWFPVWEYHRIEIDNYRVKMTDSTKWAALAETAADPSLAVCVGEAQQLQAQLTALLARETVSPKRVLTRLLTPRGFAELGRDAGKIGARKTFEQLKALLEGPGRSDGLAILRALTMHPMWHVSEAVASVIERLVESDIQHMSLINDLLDPAAHWRVSYMAIDAAYDVAGRDDFSLFERAVKLHGKSESSRVQGICADDFLAWLRMGDKKMRARILEDADLQSVLRFWIAEAEDCWLLEYVYLIIKLLKEDLKVDVDPFLSGKVSSLLEGGRPFHECGRDEFLLRIERNKAARDDVRRRDLPGMRTGMVGLRP